MTTIELVRESNRIEGILREPTAAEVAEHERFVALPDIELSDLYEFLLVYQPDAVLRNRVGLNVRVGKHIPPPGGPEIHKKLIEIYTGDLDPWEQHVAYETLHPFTDGNGRSGRALWYWRMWREDRRMYDLGFLHSFYYQTLQGVRLDERIKKLRQAGDQFLFARRCHVT